MAILDWAKELPLSIVLKERIADLETQVANLQAEKGALQAQLEECVERRRALEQQIMPINHANPDGYVCDHCGSPDLRRTGNRPDPTFKRLGIKQAVFSCNRCGQESAFTPRE